MRTVSPDPARPASQRSGEGERTPGAPSSSEGRGTAPEGPRASEESRLWPVLIVLGMTLVILVNGLFIYIAVKGADEVVPSYNTEER